jgi:SAM-dependent methyltransferase
MQPFPRVPQVRLSQLLDIKVDVTGKSILDYGGNRGNLLEDGIETGSILPENYTSMDVDEAGLNYLNELHPSTNTVLYNRHNPVYNPQGEKHLKFPFDDNTFDIVYSYSVNTHSSWSDYRFDILEMLRVSKGPIYTSILDEHCLKIMHQKRIDEFGSAVDIDIITDTVDGSYFINQGIVMSLSANVPNDIKYLLTYYKPEWLMSVLADMGLVVKMHKAPPGIQPLLEIKDN